MFGLFEKKKMYILTGPAASGKTNWANQQDKREHLTVRQFNRLHQGVTEAVTYDKHLIIDVTGITKEQILSAKSLARRFNFHVEEKEFPLQ